MNTFAEADFAAIDLEAMLASDDTGPVEVGTPAGPAQSRRIAIIGMAGKIAGCADLDAFWDLLRDGRRTRRALPPARQADLDQFLRLKGALNGARPVHYFKESFLAEVDKFDHRFFGMARQEANLTDPNQRMFFETAWSALEHAGYGGASVKGSSTGVFVGYSADFGDAYRDIVRTLAPDAPEVAVVGNVKSIIASRIAYHLDLHGPSMMIDTACSSGLVALHQACRALAAGDCEMALAGTVKIDLIPVADDPDAQVGIKDIAATMATDGRTKTFDDSSEGTSGAEGVLAFVLKPLERALADGDTVHAVILGSAVNQDGQSVGITAPNMAAQESLIVAALKDAQVHPETISYIEAHGTATRLGDPVEVAGIDRAWRHYTRRRQFCAIGSVKTNIGHMDNGAGLAGLAKVVLAMAHRELPASLNFQRPNRNIGFPNSPVFVNDTLAPWQAPEGVPLRAGINSFGLSGTNCHVIVEAAPPSAPAAPAQGPFLLPLSAASDAALARLIKSYRSHLHNFSGSLRDLCFTAALGRLHHPHRAALAFSDLAQLRAQLDALAAGSAIDGVAFGDGAAPADARQKELDRAALELATQYRRGAVGVEALAEAVQLYVQGAEFPWQDWYAGKACRRIPLPTYPFTPTRCWVEPTGAARQGAARAQAKHFAHPLLDRCAARTHGVRVFETMLGVDSHWELGEHKVKGVYILPGTAFIEMILAAAAQVGGGCPRLEQLVFLRPLMLGEGQRKPVQLLVTDSDGGHRLQVASRQDPDSDEWDVHAEAMLYLDAALPGEPVDLAALRTAITVPMAYGSEDDASRGLEIGARWNESVQQGWTDADQGQVLVRLTLPERFHPDLQHYHCHPALLDTAVNAANHLQGSGGLYLPFAYRRLEVYGKLPPDFYVHLRRKAGAASEASHFDVALFGVDGRLCAQAFDYTVKLVPDTLLGADSPAARMHHVTFAPAADQQGAELPAGAALLVVRHPGQDTGMLAATLAAAGHRVTELVAAPGLDEQLAALPATPWTGLVYAPALDCADEPDGAAQALFNFINAFARSRARCQGPMLVLGRAAFPARAGERVNPQAAAVAALARIARLENPQMRLRCLDSDGDGEQWASLILRELADNGERDLAVYRAGVRFDEHLASLPQQAPSCQPDAGGVVLITGGTGGLGLALASHLAAKGGARLALLGSREASAAARAVIARLEQDGAQVACIAADVGDAARMAEVLAELRSRFGRIAGVVHAAGRAGDGFLRNKAAETFEQVLRPKLDGAWNLHTLTAQDRPDFFVMYSSVATVLRSAGQGDYTAANAYLDALAHQRRALGLPANAICWPAWREVGIAVDYGAVDEDEFFAPIGNAEALALLDGVLAQGSALPPVLVLAEINERADLASVDALGLGLPEAVRARLRRAGARRQALAAGQGELHVRLSGIEQPDEVDLTVARLWSEILGVHELSADDDFGDLGGNSILTTQLYRAYEARYPGKVDVVDLFSHTTLATQASFLRDALGLRRAQPGAAPTQPASAEEADMDRILALLAEGDLSPEQAQAILS